MTKKSAARLARDQEQKQTQIANKKLSEHLKNNTAWSDLDKTRSAVYSLLVHESQMLGVFFGEEALMRLVPESQRQRVNSALETLKNDVVTLLEIHQGIAAKHSMFSGGAHTEEEGIRVNELYMAYMDVMARYEQLDKPLVDFLAAVQTEVTVVVQEMEVAMAAKEAAAQAAPETDQPTTQG